MGDPWTLTGQPTASSPTRLKTIITLFGADWPRSTDTPAGTLTFCWKGQSWDQALTFCEGTWSCSNCGQFGKWDCWVSRSGFWNLIFYFSWVQRYITAVYIQRYITQYHYFLVRCHYLNVKTDQSMVLFKMWWRNFVKLRVHWVTFLEEAATVKVNFTKSLVYNVMLELIK